jgi:hypothetical protein
MSSGPRNPVNRELEGLVEKAGVGKKVLDDPQKIVCDDEWTEEREKLAKEHLAKDTSTISEFWRSNNTCFETLIVRWS